MKKIFLLVTGIALIALLATGCPPTTGDNSGNTTGGNGGDGTSEGLSQTLEAANDAIDAMLAERNIDVSDATDVYMNYSHGLEGALEYNPLMITKLYMLPNNKKVSVLAGIGNGIYRELDKSATYNNDVIYQVITETEKEEIEGVEFIRYSDTINTTGYTFYKITTTTQTRANTDFLNPNAMNSWVINPSQTEYKFMKVNENEVISIPVVYNSSNNTCSSGRSPLADIFLKTTEMPNTEIDETTIENAIESILQKNNLSFDNTTTVYGLNSVAQHNTVTYTYATKVYEETNEEITILDFGLMKGTDIEVKNNTLQEVQYNNTVEYSFIDTLTSQPDFKSVTLLYNDNTNTVIPSSEYEGYTLYKGIDDPDNGRRYYLIKNIDNAIMIARFYTPSPSNPATLKLSGTVQYQKQ